jgi:hypothetical protein
MIVWGRAEDIQREVANVPINWLYRFAAARPKDIRKLGEAQGSTLLFRSAGILEAIENGECVRAYNYAAEPGAKKKGDAAAEPGAAKKKGAAA